MFVDFACQIRSHHRFIIRVGNNQQYVRLKARIGGKIVSAVVDAGDARCGLRMEDGCGRKYDYGRGYDPRNSHGDPLIAVNSAGVVEKAQAEQSKNHLERDLHRARTIGLRGDHAETGRTKGGGRHVEARMIRKIEPLQA